MTNPIVHLDFYGDDPATLAAWYKDVFGWEIESYPEYDYAVFRTGDDGPGGGFTKGAPSVAPYVEVDDLQEYIDAIVSKGGKIEQPITELPQITFAICIDPQGNRLGLALKGSGGQ